MLSNGLIQETCGASAPAAANFNVGTVDRYGNVLPTIIISADQTINWKARDFRDNYLARLIAPNSTKEAAINVLCDNLFAAGLIGKFPHLYPLIGDNGNDNSLNLAYPFSKFSNEIRWFGSPVHGIGKVQGNGTTAYGSFAISPYDMNPTSFSMGVYRLNIAINTNVGFEIGWGTINDGANIFVSNHTAMGGTPSFNSTNYYARLVYAAEANESGLFVGDVSAVKRQFIKNGVVKAQSVANLGLTRNWDVITLLNVVGNYSPSSLGFAFLGETLTPQEHIDLSTIIQNFNVAKGASFI